MGDDCGTWFPQQQYLLQSPNLNYRAAPLHSGQQNITASSMNAQTEMASTKGNLPVYPFPDLFHSRVGQTNEPRGWFYGLPLFQQALTPDSKSLLKEKHDMAPSDNAMEAMTPKGESGYGQRRFLVFDQSGDHTTVIFSSGVANPGQCLTSWNPKPAGAYALNREDPVTKDNFSAPSKPISTDKFGENNETDSHSEMHEDTEELNALLYSDDDSEYSEEDEVTSTGHSPSTMTANDKEDWFEGSTEEVASSDGSTRKRKLFDGIYGDVPSLVDTASSGRQVTGLQCEDDAESRCDDGSNFASAELVAESGNKRMRKERIRQTVSILQNIIPGGKGKNAIVVIDEAIHYLKSLKLKAKALGLAT